ncbi:MAG: hypothetical protein ACI8RD_006279 [Bacillariaceae sp.]|jgi:hypothetical protein
MMGMEMIEPTEPTGKLGSHWISNIPTPVIKGPN